MSTLPVKGSDGATYNIQQPLAPGQQNSASSKSVVLATDDPVVTVIGTKADTAAANTDTTPVSAMSIWKQISKSVQAIATSIAGTLTVAVTDTVTVATHAVTQSGNWVLAAGANIIGKVGIDQTTPGTTNKVSIGTDGTVALNAELPVGSNIIGKIEITDGTNGTVAVKAASTPAAAVDISYVTNESPNSQLSMAAGTIADTVYAGAGNSSIVAALKGIYAKLAGTLTATIGTALPAGSNVIGGVTIADGSDVTFGSKTDAANTATNTMSVSAMSVLKQISASIQAAAASLATMVSTGIITTGTAGSPATEVLSVQGATGGTPVSVLPTLTSADPGLTETRVNSAATTNATSAKTSAGNVGVIKLFNVAAYPVFMKFYDKASAPTVGTDTVKWTIPIAAGGGYCDEMLRGEHFSTGIAWAITKNQADSDTTAIAAGDVTGIIKWI